MKTTKQSGKSARPNGAKAGVRFFPAEEQEQINAYWGVMTRIGEMGDACGVFRVRFKEGVPHKSHRHLNHEELVYVGVGQIRQIIGNEERILKVGDSAFIRRGEWHSAVPLLPDTEVIVVLFGEGTNYESQEMR